MPLRQEPIEQLTSPEAMRGFVEGVDNLNAYFRTNSGNRLTVAEEQLTQSLAADPDFAPAQYYKAIVLTHARKADYAVALLENLAGKKTSFEIEILYNLTFAYAKTYNHDNVAKALLVIDQAKGLAISQQQVDMELLIHAMKAFVMAVYGGLELRCLDNFDGRKQTYLPRAAELADWVLTNEKLKGVAPETAKTVKVEANNAAGIAYMYMGKFSELLKKETESCWQKSEGYYEAARRLHARDVRVLDNLATLYLMRASRAWRDQHREEEVKRQAEAANTLIMEALSYNPHDQFRHYLEARVFALLKDTKSALAAVRKMRHEPGVFKKERIDDLEMAIRKRDLTKVVELPEEKKVTEATLQPKSEA
ncbi:MAG TPA: hypothetical protein VIT88_06375 [Pyrinomonadaceae bacterium]